MRLIDADTVVTIQVFDEMYEEYELRTMTIAEALDLWTEEGCPSADIVRCKDCIYADFKSPYPVCNLIEMNIADNDFCSWGERREP